MQLREYIARYEETQEEFAKKVGVSRNAVSAWLNKGIVPKLKHIYKVEKVTKGLVTGQDFWDNHLDFKTKLPFDKYETCKS